MQHKPEKKKRLTSGNKVVLLLSTIFSKLTGYVGSWTGLKGSYINLEELAYFQNFR